MGRYRLPPADIVQGVASTRSKVEKMERIPRASNTAVDSGTLSVNGGTLQVSGLLPSGAVGNPIFVATGGVGATSNSVKMYRNNGADPSKANLPAFEYDDVAESGSSQVPSFIIRDRHGGNIVADSKVGLGLSEPRWQVHFWDPSATKTTSSGTPTTIYNGYWYMYHPHLQITVNVNTPAATQATVQVVEAFGNTQYAVTTTANTNQQYGLTVDRNNLTVTNNVNGTPALLLIQWWVSSGTGTCTLTLQDIVGLNINV